MLWADLSDGDEDSLSEWGEEMLLGVATPESTKLRGNASQEAGDVTHQHQVSISTLNAYATEFLPTLSMSCPVVGHCEVILEEDETQGKVKAAKRRHSRYKLADAPREEQISEISEDQLQRRIRSVEAAMKSKEYHFLSEHKGYGGLGAELMTPDPQDSALSSRRSWLQAVHIWRNELRRLFLLETEGLSLENGPEVASLASTEVEETQGSELDDSTIISDDASSANWSSR
jgi:hypothetical protein